MMFLSWFRRKPPPSQIAVEAEVEHQIERLNGAVINLENKVDAVKTKQSMNEILDDALAAMNKVYRK